MFSLFFGLHTLERYPLVGKNSYAFLTNLNIPPLGLVTCRLKPDCVYLDSRFVQFYDIAFWVLVQSHWRWGWGFQVNPLHFSHIINAEYYFHQIFGRVHFGHLLFISSYESVHDNVWYKTKVPKTLIILVDCTKISEVILVPLYRSSILSI